MGGSFGVDKKTRPMMPIVELAGTTFIYSPLDDVNTHGELRAPGPTEYDIKVYVSTLNKNNVMYLTSSLIHTVISG